MILRPFGSEAPSARPFKIAAFIPLLSVSWSASADPVVELQVLNATNGNGEVILVAGEDVEVGFAVVTDTAGALDKKDEIELVLVSNDTVVAATNRGNADSGSVNLKVPSDLEQLYVRYIRRDTGETVARVAHPDDGDAVIVSIEEATIAELSSRVAALEATDPVPGPEGPEGLPGVAGPTGPEGPPGAQGPHATHYLNEFTAAADGCATNGCVYDGFTLSGNVTAFDISAGTLNLYVNEFENIAVMLTDQTHFLEVGRD